MRIRLGSGIRLVRSAYAFGRHAALGVVNVQIKPTACRMRLQPAKDFVLLC